MPYFKRDQVSLYYEVVGDRGAWIVLTPGGRKAAWRIVRYLADELARQGLSRSCCMIGAIVVESDVFMSMAS